MNSLTVFKLPRDIRDEGPKAGEMTFIRDYARRVTEAQLLDAATAEANRLRGIIEKMEQAGILQVPRGTQKEAKKIKLQRYDDLKNQLAQHEDDIEKLSESIRRDVLTRRHGDKGAARIGEPVGSSSSTVGKGKEGTPGASTAREPLEGQITN